MVILYYDGRGEGNYIIILPLDIVRETTRNQIFTRF